MALPIKNDLAAAIAVTRFGLGARPGEIEAAKTDPKAFLRYQIRAGGGGDQPEGALSSTPDNLIVFEALQRQSRQMKAENVAADDLKQIQSQIRDIGVQEMAARGRLAAATLAGFRERWTLFWANHFTVSAAKGQVAPIVGSFEREAIRPHVFGRFHEMLAATSRHPAMLLYLDQSASVGPNSPTGQSPAGRRRKAGLNENFAREIMELHTLGVDGGYTQADVTEFAGALTGWSVSRGAQDANGKGGADDPGEPGTFMFRPLAHEPGERNVLGRIYRAEGEGQGQAILADLAVHPATARHIARKVAIHFVADNPPPSLVARLETSFRATGGQLNVLAEVLIDSPEAWSPEAAKFKTPYEFMVSAWRVAGVAPELDRPQRLVGAMSTLGQRPFSPSSPKGWPDSAVEWASADGIIKRIAWAEAAANAMPPNIDPNEIAIQALGARLGPQSAAAIARAETRREAYAILLMSPEFQRR